LDRVVVDVADQAEIINSENREELVDRHVVLIISRPQPFSFTAPILLIMSQ